MGAHVLARQRHDVAPRHRAGRQPGLEGVAADAVQHRVGQRQRQHVARRRLLELREVAARQRQRRAQQLRQLALVEARLAHRRRLGQAQLEVGAEQRGRELGQRRGVDAHRHQVHAGAGQQFELALRRQRDQAPALDLVAAVPAAAARDLGDGERDRARAALAVLQQGLVRMLVEDLDEAQVQVLGQALEAAVRQLFVVLVPVVQARGLCLGLGVQVAGEVKLGHGRRGRWHGGRRRADEQEPCRSARSLQEARTLDHLAYPRSGRRLIRAGARCP